MPPRKSKEHRKARRRVAQIRRRAADRLRQMGLTTRQSKYLEAFIETRNKAKAALAAGYGGNPSDAGYQAFKRLQGKAPDVIARMGITLENVIENHLLPKLQATEIKVAQHEGEFTDFVEFDNHAIQLDAAKTLFELMGAYPPQDQVLSAQLGVKVVMVDIPRPDFSIVNVTPRSKAISVEAKISGNGHAPTITEEEDPRPKD